VGVGVGVGVIMADVGVGVIIAPVGVGVGVGVMSVVPVLDLLQPARAAPAMADTRIRVRREERVFMGDGGIVTRNV